MTEDQKSIIVHALGLNYKPRAFRNYYCAATGDAEIEVMAQMGWMARGHMINGGRDQIYYVTDLGKLDAGVSAACPKVKA